MIESKAARLPYQGLVLISLVVVPLRPWYLTLDIITVANRIISATKEVRAW
jgi:hypothetical protein